MPVSTECAAALLSFRYPSCYYYWDAWTTQNLIETKNKKQKQNKQKQKKLSLNLLRGPLLRVIAPGLVHVSQENRELAEGTLVNYRCIHLRQIEIVKKNIHKFRQQDAWNLKRNNRWSLLFTILILVESVILQWNDRNVNQAPMK